MAFLSWLFEIKQIASVGLKPSAMLSSNTVFIAAVEFPLIDFAFMFLLCNSYEIMER